MTVTSSFDAAFAAHQRQRGQKDGDALSGDVVGSRVDLKVLGEEVSEKEEVEVVPKRVGNRRGVGPGITYVHILSAWPGIETIFLADIGAKLVLYHRL